MPGEHTQSARAVRALLAAVDAADAAPDEATALHAGHVLTQALRTVVDLHAGCDDGCPTRAAIEAELGSDPT